MENLNTNIQHQPSYDTIKQQRDHFEERLKIEREKREALENQIAAFLNPIIEDKIDDVKTDLGLVGFDIRDLVSIELSNLIRDGFLSVKIELD